MIHSDSKSWRRNSTNSFCRFRKREKKKVKNLFFQKCLCGSKTIKKETSKNTNKEDAVRRCIKGYECKFIAKEKA